MSDDKYEEIEAGWHGKITNGHQAACPVCSGYMKSLSEDPKGNVDQREAWGRGIGEADMKKCVNCGTSETNKGRIFVGGSRDAREI